MKQNENLDVNDTSKQQSIQSIAKDILRKNMITTLYIMFKCIFMAAFWSIISVGLYNINDFREFGFLESLNTYSFPILFIFVILFMINLGFAIIKIINLIFSSIEISIQVFASEISKMSNNIKEIKDNTKK